MSDAAEFNVEPHPRVLQMLGEINLDQWRCIAELIDNSVDSFLHDDDSGTTADREVSVTLPSVDDEAARVKVRDTGPGMSPDTLETAVKAGWSGNDPIGSLGLFGMGFNIATARLGTRTTVWTTRRDDTEWTGICIDLAELVRQRHYRTPRLSRPKVDPADHGTEVVIEGLKPDHRAWFSKAGNRTKLRKQLGKVYASMLREPGQPISFTLYVDEPKVLGWEHCVWSGNDGSGRIVTHPRYGDVNALQIIDHRMPARGFCLSCWQWLSVGESDCPVCGAAENVVQRERRIHGWIGIQRYASEQGYGFDLIRNGRKIELANKELFYWSPEGSADTPEEEYPIDDPRHRGRIVGEIHIDHCRVNYTKNSFDRDDPTWEEMIEVVRGKGPLRPDKAAQLGYGPSPAPLYVLFQVFRRSSPKPKVAGAYARLLVVPDNDLAERMAAKFHDGELDYQTDRKWFELVEEADVALLRDDNTPTDDTGDDDLIPGGGGGPEPPEGDEGEETPEDDGGGAPPPVRESLPSLSQEYHERVTRQTFRVDGLSVGADDPDLLPPSAPWRLMRDTSGGRWVFLVDMGHEVFRSTTMTPLDALLNELAAQSVEFNRNDPAVTFAAVLAALRSDYAKATELDPLALSAQADLLLGELARSLSGRIPAEDSESYYAELTEGEREQIQATVASRSPYMARSFAEIITSGEFLEYATPRTLVRFVALHPELFFDGNYWSRQYTALDYGSDGATNEARRVLTRFYENLLTDAVWLAEQDAAELTRATRAKLMRAALSLELLDQDVEAR